MNRQPRGGACEGLSCRGARAYDRAMSTLPAPRPSPQPSVPAKGRSLSRRRVALAFVVAIVVDGLQVVLLPLMFAGAVSPAVDLIDVVAAIVLIALVGWHWAFLPTLIAEAIPFVDLVPSWTLATFIATRGRSSSVGAGSAAAGEMGPR